MPKSYFDETEEAQGGITTPLTGALVKIIGIERTKTREKGLRMYVEEVEIKQPKQYKGIRIKDWIVVGSEDDPLAKRPETWRRSEGGPGRLKRLITRAGAPLSDDDEEWMEAVEEREYVTPVHIRMDDDGEPRARLGLAFRPSDEDCPEIGEADEDDKPSKGKAKGKKGATAAGKKLRDRKKGDDDEDEDEKDDEDEDEKPKKGKKGKDEDDEDDEDEKKSSKSSKKSSKKDDDDDDDDDEDEKPKSSKAKSKSKKKDEDDDEDE